MDHRIKERSRNKITTKELQRMSKDYLNNSTISKNEGYSDVLPLVLFNYKMGGRRLLGVGFSLIGLVVPDLGLGYVVGKEIRNPVRAKSRYKVVGKDIKGFGGVLFLVGGCHSVRITLGKKWRGIKKIVIRRKYI